MHVLTPLVALAIVTCAAQALAITSTPSWETPEVIDTGVSLERVNGQDRFLDFDHFGVAGLALPKGPAYWRRINVAGWTRQPLDGINSTHASLAFDRSEMPVIASVVNFNNFELFVYQLDSTNVLFDRQILEDTQSGPTPGTSVSVDPLGRSAIAYVRGPGDTQVRYTIDADGNGLFDDDSGNPLSLNVAFSATEPSLDFDPQARPHVAYLFEAVLGFHQVRVASGDVGVPFGTTIPEASVNSTSVSLAVNPLTGHPAIAYNDVQGNALRYAEWDGEQWNAETVETQGNLTSAQNMPVSLAFDPADGLPAIAYTLDFSSGIIGQPPQVDLLRFAWHDGTGWNRQTVDNTPGVAGGAVSLAFNEAFVGGFGDGLPAIAYVADDGTVRYVHDPPLMELPGDFNANGQVEQRDLDLVLLHWGDDGGALPHDWIRYRPDGSIDQQELDAVLLNWDQAVDQFASPASAVPEPAGAALAIGTAALLLVTIRHASRKRGNC